MRLLIHLLLLLTSISTILNDEIKSVGLTINAPIVPAYLQILTPDALKFIAALCEQFEARRRELLTLRIKRQKEISQGNFPDFLSETKNIREVTKQIPLSFNVRLNNALIFPIE